MIDGVVITPLKQIKDDRGTVMHMLRNDSPLFSTFGEVYFSTIEPGKIKAWKRHLEMVMNLTVVSGRISLVLCDQRADSPTQGEVQEIILGSTADEYQLVTVPALIWNGFKGLSDSPAIIANCASIPHRAEEIEYATEDDVRIPYEW